MPNFLDETAVYSGLDPRQVVLERVAGAILGGVLLVAVGVAGLLTGLAWQFSAWWWIGLAAVGMVWAAFSLFLLIWPAIDFRHVRWKLDGVGLEIQRGVFWRHVISVPLARLQHADIAQGPLQRQWGLATLIVYTAGTEHASVALEGLAYETAVQLRDALIQPQGAVDVV